MVFEEENVNILHERALGTVYNEKRLIATSTLEGLLFDLDVICNDRQWSDGFFASISTFGLAGFCGAKLGQVTFRLWGNCGDAEGVTAS